MSLFTPTQAAVATGLPLKTVQKAIDLRAVPTRIVKSGKNRKRYLSEISLLCLELEASGLQQLPLVIRRQVFQTISRTPRTRQVRVNDAFFVDVSSARKRLALRLKELKKAEQMVSSDANVMSGTPVFRGTRIPVNAIAEMIQAGASPQEILEGYPSLNAEKLHLATVYSKAHPQRGRPRVQPCNKVRPARRVRKRLRPTA